MRDLSSTAIIGSYDYCIQNQSNMKEVDISNMNIKGKNPYVAEANVEEVNVTVTKLTFQGGEDQFQAFAEALTPAIANNVEEVDFRLQGRTVEQNVEAEASDSTEGLNAFMLKCECCPESCACLACILSCCFLMLFWWIICPVFYCCLKRKVEKLVKTSMTISPYNALEQMGPKLTLNKIHLTISDNSLSREKWERIAGFARKSGAKELTVVNLTVPLNGEGSEFDDFEDNIGAITELGNLKYHLSWDVKTRTNI